MNNIGQLRISLAGGDRRSNHQAHWAIAETRKNPKLFAELIQLIADPDPLVAMRAADAVEKLTQDHPEWLQPRTSYIVDQLTAIQQKEVVWHIEQLLPRLRLTAAQRQKAVDYLTNQFRNTKNGNITRVFAMQALVDMHAPNAGHLIDEVLDEASAPPSLKTRARNLYEQTG